MYRKLKNILGVSLMVLAIVISQIPMPEAQAAKEPTEQELWVDDVSAHTVTFSMNGGTFNGEYNGYSFEGKTPVLVIDDGETISVFPDDKHASCSGYKTENIWYTDKECLVKFDADSPVKESITLYKKWFQITSDGTASADKGFHISADGTVLYQYDGDEINVKIPQKVTTIAEGAFSNFEQVRGITLPADINRIEKDAFRGVKGTNTIIYIYDSGTDNSKEYGKKLADEYEQLVYSEYLDAESTEKIVGIDYQSDTEKEESPEVKEGSETKTGESEENKSEENKAGEGKPGESKPEESKTEEKSSEDDSKESSPTVIIVEPNTDKDVKESEPEESTPKGSEPEESTPKESEPEGSTSKESEPEGSTPKESEPEESTPKGSEPEESKTDSQPAESESEESSSSVIIVEPDTKYTVTFNTGISGVDGEKREVLSKRTVSELVSVDGNQPKLLKKDEYRIERDDGKQEITYIFKGWYKDKEFTKEWDFDNDVIEDNTTIYAKWDMQTRAYFYVTYQAAEGYESAANIPDKQKLYEDENLAKPSKNPSVKNKVFKGWYTDEKDTSTEYKSWGKPITKDMTLYAQFEEKSYTVVFHMNGGGFTGNYKGTSYTDAASLKANITAGAQIASADYPQSGTSASFKYSNYATDSNWYKDKEGLDVYSQNGAAVNGDLTLYKKWYYTSSGFTMNTSSNVLYKYSGSVADVAIPNTVTVIGADAFSSVGSISTITLPDNISDVKDNAFSGVDKISKDINITGKTDNAKNVAKGLANQYKHLVYKDTAATDTASVVSTTESGSIQLGATIGGSAGTAKSTTPTAASGNTAAQTGSITLGAGIMNTGTAASQVITPVTQGTVPTQGVTSAQAPAANQNSTSVSSQKSPQGSSASVKQGTKTTTKSNITSASAPRGTEHIKDSTPKTGDPLQYRMLIVCAMFSVGALLVLSGNGKKKKFSAS